MDRVATFSGYSSVITSLLNSQVRQHEAQVQVSTGKIASDLKGFSGQAEALTATRTLKIRVDSFLEGTKAIAAKLSAQDLALNQVLEAGQGARDAIANAIATGRGDGLMVAIKNYFKEASAALNTQYNGHYIFAGGKVDTPPVPVDELADLPAPPVDPSFFQNDQQIAAVRLDEATTVQPGMLASDVATDLFNAFAQVQAFETGPDGSFGGLLTQAQTDFLTGMLQTFDTTNRSVTDTVASNGLMQDRVDRSQTIQEDRQKVLEVMLGDITDVDVAEAVSRLSQAQVAMQASAHVFATLQDSSLLNYLS